MVQAADWKLLARRLPESWAVVGQDNKLGFALTDHLLGLFVAQDVFPTLHHQLETRVDGLHGLFLEEKKNPQTDERTSERHCTRTEMTRL